MSEANIAQVKIFYKLVPKGFQVSYEFVVVVENVTNSFCFMMGF